MCLYMMCLNIIPYPLIIIGFHIFHLFKPDYDFDAPGPGGELNTDSVSALILALETFCEAGPQFVLQVYNK